MAAHSCCHDSPQFARGTPVSSHEKRLFRRDTGPRTKTRSGRCPQHRQWHFVLPDARGARRGDPPPRSLGGRSIARRLSTGWRLVCCWRRGMHRMATPRRQVPGPRRCGVTPTSQCGRPRSTQNNGATHRETDHCNARSRDNPSISFQGSQKRKRTVKLRISNAVAHACHRIQ